MQIQANTTSPVSTLPRGAAISVPNLEADHAPCVTWRTQDQHLVASNTIVTVSDAFGAICFDLKILLAQVQQDKIVTRTVHFVKSGCHQKPKNLGSGAIFVFFIRGIVPGSFCRSFLVEGNWSLLGIREIEGASLSTSGQEQDAKCRQNQCAFSVHE
jgi:hypothetical protein